MNGSGGRESSGTGRHLWSTGVTAGSSKAGSDLRS